MTTEDKRQATLKELHDVIQDTDGTVDQHHAVMMMAIRYGAGRVSATNPELDYELVSRARSRRFSALQRLVYALDGKS